MKEDLLKILQPYHQEHLLAFWDELDQAQQGRLAEQIKTVDLPRVAEMYSACCGKTTSSQDASRAEPPVAVRLGETTDADEREAEQVGLAALAEGKVGVALVAGGQGSRLGFDHPKGMYPIGPISGATLFDILLGKVIATRTRANAPVPIYLMTSPATHQETVSYLKSEQNFGIPASEIMVFCQGTMPAVDATTGKLLLESKGSLFLSPDGHGGMLSALSRCAALEDMRQRGIKHLFYFQIDNPLATVCDPTFIGHHILAESEYTLQVIAKQKPEDKVGNVVQLNGKTQIIEYSDLPTEAANLRNPDGSLKLWAGSIAVHVFDVDFLCRLAAQKDALPIHFARKKVNFVNSTGEFCQPHQPNAIKFEQFIFDLLPAASKTITVEVDPAMAFAPLKNGPDGATDTAEHVQQQLMKFHRHLLRAAGLQVNETARVEVDPRFGITPEILKDKVATGSVITDGTYLQ
ncbi:MAG: UDPGP type 1 family protein [Planctomycetota bacterium]|nr:UDPGP type 1 family protein [Planctomycetota bacterium]